jgi:penicillin-binding protein 1A
MGVTPNLVTGIWVGGEDRDIHFDNIAIGQGANMALPIWALYMQKAYDDEEVPITQKDTFEKPVNFNINLDCPDRNVRASEENSGSIDTISSEEEFF